MAEVRTLSGHPSVPLVKSVKQLLWQYLRCKPLDTDANWQQTWEWAAACRDRTAITWFSNQRVPWPSPSEIATQYLLLAMSQLRDDHQLNIHRHAVEAMPQSVSLRLTAAPSVKSVSLIGMPVN